MNWTYLLPVGAVRLLEARNRLKALGVSPLYALKREYRKALAVSQIELLPEELRRSLKRVVDVGANVGEWSVGIALLTSATEIVAYEPIPEVFRTLEEKARAFPRIRARNCAIGGRVGSIDLHVHAISELSSVLLIQEQARIVHGLGNQGPSTVRVSMSTLDDELDDQDEVSLLKLDVQGYEPQVIEGASRVWQRTRALMIEVTYTSYYKGDIQFGELNDLIRSRSPLKLWGISSPHCSASGQPMWADAVYVSPQVVAP